MNEENQQNLQLRATASETTFVKKAAPGIHVNDHEDKKRKRVVTNEEKLEINYTKDMIPTSQYMVKYARDDLGTLFSEN